jgi:hypothetical protein
MSRLGSALAAGAIMAGLALTTTAASADVACNRWGECWHVHDRIAYPGGLGVVWHPDGWRAKHMHWRKDRFDHGYYRNGVWIAF